MVLEKNVKKDPALKRLEGIIVPYEPKRYKDKLAILTPKGNLIPLIRNSKLSLLGNLVWESVSIIARLHLKKGHPFLEVIYFSINDSYKPELLDEQTEDAADLVRHVDYETFSF